MAQSFTAWERFWQFALFHMRPAVAASWLKRLVGLRRRDIQTEFGVFYVDPASQFALALTSARGYEPEMRAALEHCLKPPGVFVDLGANEGFLAILGARLVGETGRVVAVEPQSRLKAVLERNFELNHVRNVVLFSCAVSDHEGEGGLYVSPDMNTGSSAMQNSTRYPLRRETVPLMTLSRLFERAEIEHADLVKMDIEGAEYEAVLGSVDLFRTRRIRAFTFELHREVIAARGKDPDAVQRLLRECGYALVPGLPAQVWVPSEPARA